MERENVTSRLPLIGLMAVQVIVGYEWFISGLTSSCVAASRRVSPMS